MTQTPEIRLNPGRTVLALRDPDSTLWRRTDGTPLAERDVERWTPLVPAERAQEAEELASRTHEAMMIKYAEAGELRDELTELRAMKARLEEKRNSLGLDAHVHGRELRLTPSRWCEIKGIEVLDFDGWADQGSNAWLDPITETEFDQRAARSTVEPLTEPDLPEELTELTTRMQALATQLEADARTGEYRGGSYAGAVLVDVAQRIRLALKAQP